MTNNTTSAYDQQLSRILAVASTNPTNLKASAGAIEEIVLFNTTASAAYVKFYDKATAPTVGTDTPAFTLQVAANGSVVIPAGLAIPFAIGIGYAITGAATDTDATPVTAGSITGYVLWSPPAYLMLDTFQGSGSLTGRLPDIGPVWVQASDNTSVVVANGAMTQTISGLETYSTIAASAPVGEIRATFSITTVQCQYTYSGTPDASGFIAISIWASGSLYNPHTPETPTMEAYQVTSSTDLPTDLMALIGLINDNPAMQAAGISASLSGTTVIIISTSGAIPFTKCTVSGGGGTLAYSQGDQTSPAFGNYLTGQAPTNGTLHCIVSSSGVIYPSFFISSEGGVVDFASMTTRFDGLIPGESYTFKWCIQPPYCWAGIWTSDGTLRAGAIGQDSGMAAYHGNSAFWENGTDANNVYYTQASLLPTPSVPMAVIQNFING